jgi:hypothetical protein
MAGGDVMICVLPLVWHCVVFGETLVHFGAAEPAGAVRIAKHGTASNAARYRTMFVMTYSDPGASLRLNSAVSAGQSAKKPSSQGNIP